MRSRKTALLVVSSAAALALAAVACAGSADGTESGNADLSAAKAAAADPPGVALANKLVGAWVRKGGTGDGDLALTITSFLPPEIGISRDQPHKATAALDQQEVDRSDQSVSFTSVSGDSGGTFEWEEVIDLPTGEIERITTYSFTIASAGGTDTLTLTATAQRVKDASGGDAGTVDAGPTKLDPPETFTRASSWCAKTTSTANPTNDCVSEFREDTWKPTNMPADCKGKEEVCMACENHECKTREVSTCELARFSCFDTNDQCEFDANGKPAGQVAVLDTKGNPIDCKKSPTGKPVCCQSLIPKFNPTIDPIFIAPALPPPP